MEELLWASMLANNNHLFDWSCAGRDIELIEGFSDFSDLSGLEVSSSYIFGRAVLMRVGANEKAAKALVDRLVNPYLCVWVPGACDLEPCPSIVYQGHPRRYLARVDRILKNAERLPVDCLKSLWGRLTDFSPLDKSPLRGEILKVQVHQVTRLSVEQQPRFFGVIHRYCNDVDWSADAGSMSSLRRILRSALRARQDKVHRALLHLRVRRIGRKWLQTVGSEVTRPHCCTVPFQVKKLKVQERLLTCTYHPSLPVAFDVLSRSQDRSWMHDIAWYEASSRARTMARIHRILRIEYGQRLPLRVPADYGMTTALWEDRHLQQVVKLHKVPKPAKDPANEIPKLLSHLSSLSARAPQVIMEEDTAHPRQQFFAGLQAYLETLAISTAPGYQQMRWVLTHYVARIEKMKQEISQCGQSSERQELQGALDKELYTVLVEDLGTSVYHCRDRKNELARRLYFAYITGELAGHLSAKDKILLQLARLRDQWFTSSVQEAVLEYLHDRQMLMGDQASTLAFYRYEMRQMCGLGTVALPRFAMVAIQGLEPQILGKFEKLYSPINVSRELAKRLREAELKRCDDQTVLSQYPIWSELQGQWLEAYYPKLTSDDYRNFVEWDDEGITCWLRPEAIATYLADIGVLQPLIMKKP